MPDASTDNALQGGLQNRTTPHNDDAERAVLAAMILDEDIIVEALAALREGDFYRPSHRRMFAAMKELSDRGIPVDQISLADHLSSKGELEAIGLPSDASQLFSHLTLNTPNS